MEKPGASKPWTPDATSSGTGDGQHGSNHTPIHKNIHTCMAYKACYANANKSSKLLRFSFVYMLVSDMCPVTAKRTVVHIVGVPEMMFWADLVALCLLTQSP